MPNGTINPLRLSLFALAVLAAAQQQHPLPNGHGKAYRSSPQENSALRPHTHIIPAQEAPASISIDANYKKRKDTLPQISKNERAVATYAPAELNTAVRDHPARSAAGPNRGLSNRARSLQDWEVTDFVLLATIDGSIYARDRNTGKERWKFYSERPMVETVYHDRFGPVDQGNQPGKDFLFYVEPNNGGNLYMYMPGPKPELQKLGITVRQLAEELSPYADDASNFVYTAERKNTLLTLNATNGAAIKFFGPAGSGIIDSRSCRPFNGLEMEDDECEPTPTINLGRTDYTVSIQDRTTGEDVCTIKFFEWTSNNRDRDLYQQYSSAMDGKYIYSRFDGSINALKHDAGSGSWDAKLLYKQKLDSPVVRVFDVARPQNSDTRSTALVLLPQPVPPAIVPEIDQQVFVNCTESGTWYALSELNYPSVTDGAFKAKVYGRPIFEDPGDVRHFELVPEELVGVHSLSDGTYGQPALIDGPQQHLPIVHTDRKDVFNETFAGSIDPPLPWLLAFPYLSGKKVATGTSAVALLLAVCAYYWIRPQWPRSFVADNGPIMIAAPLLEKPSITSPEAKDEENIDSPKAVKFDPVVKTMSKSDEFESSEQPYAENQVDDMPSVGEEKAGDGAADDVDADGDKKKKKTHRGQRGGKKRKPKGKGDKGDKEPADEEVERIMDDPTPPRPPIKMEPEHPEEKERVLVVNSADEVPSHLQYDRLICYKDQILGYGSGGTVVYKGQFEGRDVAVKRMLHQYYDLASREVELLQKSDDHPNVIRYFCQQKTHDFLYIAVERCQASLWDLYKDGEARDGLKEEQLSLLTATNSNVANALYQLAAGLHHLHGLRIIHRDIKPQNILIAYPRPNQKNLRFVISDFGLCRTLPNDVSTLAGTIGANAGTVGWKAPELIGASRTDTSTSDPNAPRSGADQSGTSKDGSSQDSSVETGSSGVKRAVDIFSLGCVYFYVLTNGGHPFDSKEELEIWHAQREMNIKKGLMNLDKLKRLGDDESVEPTHLIEWMLAPKPEGRPTASQVLNHPFFWSAQKRLNFLCDVSDHFEREPRGPPFSVEPMSDALWTLEDQGEEVHGGDFLRRLDKKFVDSLGKQRKYTADRMLDLLRALRNKRHHYADLSDELKLRVGELPSGYLKYWTSRFPRLLIVCWNVVMELGLESDARFRGYLTEAGS